MKDERYAHLSGETLEAITIMTDYKILAANREAYRNVDENGREEYNMCEALRELREDFLNEGRKEEHEKAVLSVISLCKEFHCSSQQTVDKLKEKCNLTREEAEAKVKMYWEQD